jgi:hypothetical protein
MKIIHKLAPSERNISMCRGTPTRIRSKNQHPSILLLSMKLKSTIILTAALVAAPAYAAITYVDAVSGVGGNTRATGLPQSNGTWLDTDAGTALDNAWRPRAFGNGATLFQAIPVTNATPPPMPELTTTVNVANGIYHVHVFFWAQVTTPTQNWVISAGLESGSLTTYNASSKDPIVGVSQVGVTNAGDLMFTNSVMVEETINRQMYGVNLGQVNVTDGSFNVFVDMLIPGSGSTQRVWYDGVGFEVIPEPSTALLSGLGVGALLRRRR